MIGAYDTYYSRPEVSNSDLTELWKYFLPGDRVLDLEKAFRFGNLVDAMITEKERVDFYSLKVDNEQFTSEEFEVANRMLNVFRKDELCMRLLSMSTGQLVFNKQINIDYYGFLFSMPGRCKYDLFAKALGWGGDIKSTACTTQKAFEDSIRHFDYDRSRSWYMDLSGADKDVIIGISKINYKIFKVYINRGDKLYNDGKEKYQELAFKWWLLMEGLQLN